MSASLVGSEMCIRDRPSVADCLGSGWAACGVGPGKEDRHGGWRAGCVPVSYTHLTLPTICSV
eukprot:5384999-Alexandrium_andersonii.AAC.1